MQILTQEQVPHVAFAPSNKLSNLHRLEELSSRVGFQVPKTRTLDRQAFAAALTAAGQQDLDNAEIQSISDEHAKACREALVHSPLPQHLQDLIHETFAELSAGNGSRGLCARSCFHIEDATNHSLAGIFVSVLSATTPEDLCRAVQLVYASAFSSRAISALRHAGVVRMPHMSVAIQTMVGGAGWFGGVAHTQDPDLSELGLMLVSVDSDCESVTSGAYVPEDYLVNRATLNRCDRAVIIQKRAGTRTETVFRLSDAQMRVLARKLVQLEIAFGAPLEVEWQQSPGGSLFILQARPLPPSPATQNPAFPVDPDLRPICSGLPVGNGHISAPAFRAQTVQAASACPPGHIIVTHSTDPEWNTIIRNAAGLVTELGARTSHVSRVAREEGVLALVGCGDQIDNITDGQLITLVCSEAIRGDVFDGAIKPVYRRRPTSSLAVSSTTEALSLSRVQKPAEVELDLSTTLWSLGLPERPNPAILQDTVRARRRYAGHSSPEAFVVSRFIESICLTRLAFPSAKLFVGLRADCDWQHCVSTAVADCERQFGISCQSRRLA